MASDKETGIALLQMGGPRGPEELPGFLRALFQDPEMIRLPKWLRPLQGPLGAAYGSHRAREVREEYEAIGWSPLVETVSALGDELQARLDGRIAGVEAAMRYTQPRAAPALERLTDAGIEHVLALPLYPFFSLATTGSSLKDLRRARDALAPGVTIEAIHDWGTLPGHVDLVAKRLGGTLEEVEGEDRAVLLSAHGLPESYVHREQDPYRDQVEKGAQTLSDRFPNERFQLAFQSDVGPVDWLEPSTPDTIEKLAADGVDELVVVPFGFVAEHIETAYEIDEEYRQLAHEAGISEVHRVPTFGAAPDLAGLLSDLVRARLEAPA